MTSSRQPSASVGRVGGPEGNQGPPSRTLPVHGHVIRLPSHVMFVGRNTKRKQLVVIFRQGAKAYVYNLGDSFHPKMCCEIAKLSNPGTFISSQIKQFPVEDFV